MHKFTAKIEIIGVNPFIFVPEDILQAIFRQANKDKGSIPIRGTINQQAYRQTLVRFSGAWRLYINTSMLKDSPKRIGELLEMTIDFDPESRKLEIPEKFAQALAENPEAQKVFHQLSASRQLEIVRYLVKLKSESARERNTHRAINFLLGKERFVGREKP